MGCSAISRLLFRALFVICVCCLFGVLRLFAFVLLVICLRLGCVCYFGCFDFCVVMLFIICDCVEGLLCLFVVELTLFILFGLRTLGGCLVLC